MVVYRTRVDIFLIYSLTWLATILVKERTYYVKENVCLDPKLSVGAIHIVWVKVVLETEVNCEKNIVRSVIVHMRPVSK